MSGQNSSGRPEDGRFSEDELRLGYVNGVFGLQGELRIFLYNPDSTLFDDAREVHLVSEGGKRLSGSMTIRPGSGRRILGRFSGSCSIDDAEKLVGHEIIVPVAVLPELPDGEWYHSDLLGAEVLTDAGRRLGVLRDVVPGAAVDTWEVVGPEGRWWIHARLDDILDVQPKVRITVRDDAPMLI